MEFLQQFLGRFHPLLVHLPIGILILAFVFEVLSLRKQFEYLKPAVQISLWIGALSAILSCVSGYLLSLEGGYVDNVLTPHQYFGIATAILSFLLLLLRRSSFITRAKQKYSGVLLFMPLILVLSITGHLGGALTHGEEYLSFEIVTPTDNVVSFSQIENIDQAILYHDVVQPILKSKCYSCHSAKKQKGDLRLDEIEFIKRGGKEGEIIIHGLPDSSSLYKLLLLPLEHDRHMPPKGKPQPTSAEMAILKNWIAGGASFEKQVKDFADHDKLKSYITSLQSAPTKHWVPTEEVAEGNAQAIAVLKSKAILVLPVAQGNNYVMVNFINKKEITNEDLNSLLMLKEQLLWLSLEGTTITDDQLAIVSNLENLRWLNLNGTKISDQGISMLPKLHQIQFINLVSTQLTDTGLDQLSTLKKLEKIYAFNTKVSRLGIDSFHKVRPVVSIDTGGYRAPNLPSDSILFKRKI